MFDFNDVEIIEVGCDLFLIVYVLVYCVDWIVVMVEVFKLSIKWVNCRILDVCNDFEVCWCNSF